MAVRESAIRSVWCSARPGSERSRERSTWTSSSWTGKVLRTDPSCAVAAWKAGRIDVEKVDGLTITEVGTYRKSSSSLDLRLPKSGVARARSATPPTGTASAGAPPGRSMVIAEPSSAPRARAASALRVALSVARAPDATRIEGWWRW